MAQAYKTLIRSIGKERSIHFYRCTFGLNNTVHGITTYVPSSVCYKYNVINKTHKQIFKTDLLNFSTKYIDEEDFVHEPENINDGYNEYQYEKQSKFILYPECNDLLLNKLTKCESFQEAVDIINGETDTINHMHVCQAVLVLWKLQKAYFELYVENLGKNDVELNPNHMLQCYINNQISNDGFIKIVDLLSIHRHKLSVKELSKTLFCLRKLGVKQNNPAFNQLLECILDKFNDKNVKWDLDSLTDYVCSVYSTNIGYIYLAKCTIPIVINHMDNCRTVDDFETILKHFIVTRHLVSFSLLEKIKTKCTELINSSSITQDNVSVVLKALYFLSLNIWCHYNIPIITSLCYLIKPYIKSMNISDISLLFKIYRRNLEPSSIIEEIKHRAAFLMEQAKDDDRIKTYMKLPDLLYCGLVTSLPKDKEFTENTILNLLQLSNQSVTFRIHHVLKYLKMDNNKVCDKFWEKTIDHILQDEVDLSFAFNICFKYMFYHIKNKNNMYRNTYFEENMLKYLHKMMTQDVAYYVPWKYVRYFSFVLAYEFINYTKSEHIKNVSEMIKKLNDISIFFTPNDLLTLSNAIDIFYEFRSNNNIIMGEIKTVSNIMHKSLHNIISQKYLSSRDLKSIYCAFNREEDYDIGYFDKLISKFISIKPSELNLRIIKDITRNFSRNNIFVTNVFEDFFNYIKMRNEDTNGETLSEVLQAAHKFAYPSNDQDFFDIAIKIIERDKYMINCLSLLRSVQALCSYGHINEGLIQYIFSLEFMERLDNEILNAYSKYSYPNSLRYALMQLNRTVCLDYPQYSVPWFHQKYVDSIIYLGYTKKTSFHEDVMEHLFNLITLKESISCSHYSPYGYKVNFYFLLNRFNRVIMPNINLSDSNIKKIAIILLYDKDFVKLYYDESNVKSNIKQILTENGSIQLKIKHLQQLGYHVITIVDSFWNSMHMSEPGAKSNFLKKKIFDLR